jgi:ABC-2 type transport system permease protein
MSGALRVIWAVACADLRAWLRSPWAIAAALVPPLGLAAFVWVLTLAVGRQPVALVVQGDGAQTRRIVELFKDDAEAYALKQMSADQAQRELATQQVAAIVTIPADFDTALFKGNATVRLDLNNVNLDLADDLRRTVTRTVGEVQAPILGTDAGDPFAQFAGPDPYLVTFQEHLLRRTTVGFEQYQVIPVLILAVLNIGVLGTALLCVREFEGKTAKLLLLSPASRSAIAAGKLLGGLLATAAVVAPLVVVSAWRGIVAPPPGHWPSLIALLAAVGAMSAGLGLLLGVAMRRGRLVTMVGLNAAIALFFLGGGFTTVAFLPDWIQAISRLLPSSYAIDGLRQTLFYPDLLGVGRDLLMLGGCALASIVLGTVALSRGWRRA